MTSQRPRIYIYKITFEEVPYYYYGVHKEKRYNEYYMGSPVTHKWMWKFYTPKKQILQFFDYSDEGWIEAQELEKRLIRPFYNTDKWCLNENVCGAISMEVIKKCAKMGGYISYEKGAGIHSLTREQKQEQGRKNGRKCYEEKLGIFSIPPEERSKISRKNGEKIRDEKIGIFSITSDERSEIGRKSCSQKWICTETGYISSPCGLSTYQKKRGIDTKNRRKIICD